MMRTAGFATVLAAAALAAMLAAAQGDEIRRTEFAKPLFGTWAPADGHCDGKAAISIAQSAYDTGKFGCKVLWIVETAGAFGPNYGIHAACERKSSEKDAADASADPLLEKARAENIIMRPQGDDRVLVGTTFEDLKPYRRCPAQ